ncbi:hypothetical protein MU852_11965 [Brevundimonas albigilva]|uniref:hypothetical protein n=1 Tax=Brevundimonas albigilva TaxID=1312364 RepID=UPI00201B57D0|nr:hypothetical protein [Brevundimonas albigilva]UQV17568.1 hypothetical protein MU852_11965 [Brevundimonas albigilva]
MSLRATAASGLDLLKLSRRQVIDGRRTGFAALTTEDDAGLAVAADAAGPDLCGE